MRSLLGPMTFPLVVLLRVFRSYLIEIHKLHDLAKAVCAGIPKALLNALGIARRPRGEEGP